MKRTAALIAVIAGALAISGCGFKPIYATREGDAQISSQIYLKRVVAPESVASHIEDALNARIIQDDSVTPRYELVVQARETAERLAVQIDATVTRYNYRIGARYWVVDQQTGDKFAGIARAVTSYNIVNSQYSTLFAERAAVEKAARELAEEIERDILIRFSQPREERDVIDKDAFEGVLEPEEVLREHRRRDSGGVVKLPEELYYLMPEAERPAPDENESAENAAIVETGDNVTGSAGEGATPDVPDPVIDDRP